MNQSNSRSSSFYVTTIILGLIVYSSGWLHGRFLGDRWPFDLAKHDEMHSAKLDPHGDHDAHDHAGHDHGHSDENSLELSETAMKNLGLTDEYLRPIELASFDRTISVPAIVVDRPDRTRLPVSAATTGIITHVHAVTGEALSSGDLILEMRLTHEDLVTSQKEFLQALGDRDVEMKEIARIEKIANTGAVSSKTLLDRQYSRDKIDSLLKSQREALRLHGLSEKQIEMIESDRRLLTELKIRAPDPDRHSAEELQLGRQGELDLEHEQKSIPIHVEEDKTKSAGHRLVLQNLHVQKGQVVSAGELLCTLADFGELLIEGQAFESEASLITKAKTEDWKIAALLDEGSRSEKLADLELEWVDNEIDPLTRTLKFYVRLPNVLMQENVNATGHRHIAWRFRTGQRMQMQVPVERWTEQIVLPVDAVVREGIDSFVFQQNGDHYERIAVHERHRDQTSVVIENDGTLYPGDVVARRGAHQLQMALKNKSGGAVDPHAGHEH